MTIDVDHIVSGTALIIGYHTGIFITAQCGGLACTHPQMEGFVIDLGSFMDDFNDCKYGCHHIPELDAAAKLTLATDIDKKLTSYRPFILSFDFDRINEMQEGWWPVRITGEIDSWNKAFVNTIGFIHNGNCD